jgi:hypothetical protein
MGSLPYRDFYYPLNVFMHILTHEEGSVDSLHYGLFENEDESLPRAQQRSTDLLVTHLPPAPARLLEVGIGIGTTLARLTRDGYDIEGITPDASQIATAKERYGDGVRATCASFETFVSSSQYDCVFFQESSQYIESGALFAKAAQLTGEVIVLDEFSLQETQTHLHSLAAFKNAAAANGFSVVRETDLSAQAAPTVNYFTKRLPSWRARLVDELRITGEQVDELIRSGDEYRQRYREGVYGYRMLKLRRKT